VTAEDARLLHLAEAGHQMATFMIVTLNGPPPPREEITKRVAELVDRLGRYRSVPVAVPFDLQRPVWAAADRFELADHIVFSSLEGPGDEAEVARLMARLATRRLTGNRPPWELWMVTGLMRDRWLLASRVHLALVDGLTASDLLGALLDDDLSSVPVEPAESRPAPLNLVVDAVRELLTSPYEQVRAFNALMGRDRASRPAEAPPDLYHRRFTSTLAELTDVRDRLGGNVNDVLAALVAAGLSGVDPERTTVRFALPFAVRSLSRPGHYDNQVAVDVVELPVGTGATVDRYHTISARLDAFSRDNLAIGGKALARLSGFSPPLLLALGARAVMGVTADVALVNAPGPAERISAFDRPVVDAHATIPHPAGVRWSATALSYGGRVSIGITSTTQGQPARIVEAMRAELGRLTESAQTAPPGRSS
jgi:diacylglycerol O-acyltransferase / wax synthase